MTSVSNNINLNNVTNHLSLQDFCDLTRRGCTLKYFPCDRIVNSPIGWAKLADAWEALVDETDLDIMRDAAYRIKWGIKPTGPSPVYPELIDEVCKALLSDGPAYDAWIQHDYCSSAIFETADEYNPWSVGGSPHSFSYWHHRYTEAKMLLKILNYRKGHITKCKDMASFVRHYECRILKLLPNAAHWSAEYWLNENNIFDELANVCSYDYRHDLSAYHALLCLTTSPKRMPNSRDSDIVRCAATVHQLPSQWSKAIWPAKTESVIIQLFLLAEKRAREIFNDSSRRHSYGGYDAIPDVDYTVLSQSWLCTYANDLLENAKCSASSSEAIKRALFNVSIRY